VISDNTSSFATFEHRTGQRCQFLTETGTAPVVTPSTAFAPGLGCDSVLASSRYAKSGKVYYLAILKTLDQQLRVAVTAVSPDGGIAIKTLLAAFINRNGATGNMKAAGAALIKALQ
jgi:hypothetical protein